MRDGSEVRDVGEVGEEGDLGDGDMDLRMKARGDSALRAHLPLFFFLLVPQGEEG